MLELVTRAEAAAQLRITLDSNGGDDGPWLDIFIPAISQAVAQWLKDEWRLYVPELDSNGDVLKDSNGDPIPTVVVQPIVKGAVLVELASAFRFREGEGTENVVPADAGYGYMLNKTSTAMLAALRKTTIA